MNWEVVKKQKGRILRGRTNCQILEILSDTTATKIYQWNEIESTDIESIDAKGGIAAIKHLFSKYFWACIMCQPLFKVVEMQK